MSTEPGQTSPADGDAKRLADVDAEAAVVESRDAASREAQTQDVASAAADEQDAASREAQTQDVASAAADEQDAASSAQADLVERADAELSSLDELPLADQPEVYARIHETLNRELADIDGA